LEMRWGYNKVGAQIEQYGIGHFSSLDVLVQLGYKFGML